MTTPHRGQKDQSSRAEHKIQSRIDNTMHSHMHVPLVQHLQGFIRQYHASMVDYEGHEDSNRFRRLPRDQSSDFSRCNILLAQSSSWIRCSRLGRQAETFWMPSLLDGPRKRRPIVLHNPFLLQTAINLAMLGTCQDDKADHCESVMGSRQELNEAIASISRRLSLIGPRAFRGRSARRHFSQRAGDPSFSPQPSVRRRKVQSPHTDMPL